MCAVHLGTPSPNLLLGATSLIQLILHVQHVMCHMFLCRIPDFRVAKPDDWDDREFVVDQVSWLRQPLTAINGPCALPHCT